MDPHLILGIVIGLPVLLLTLFRANAATAFLALSLGGLLGKYVGVDLVRWLRGYIAPDSLFAESVVSLLLLWVPVFLVSFFMLGSISKKQRIINLLPALAVGLVGALLTIPFLTPEVQVDVMLSDGWIFLESHQAIVVSLGTIISLLLLRLRKPFDEGHKKKRRH